MGPVIGALSCNYASVLPYAAYLRVYEPLTAFPEPERSMWAAYAEALGPRVRGATAGAEHDAALRRLIAEPPVVVPAVESRDAYLRRDRETVYVCPWQTRLRSWLALERFAARLPAELTDAFVPRPVSRRADAEFQRWKDQRGSLRVHILSSTWRVPLVWFVSFDPAERWLVLDGDTNRGKDRPATGTRALVYVTSMAKASERLARAVQSICRDPDKCPRLIGLEELRGWLTEFHPSSLVELDYGGLVYLLDDESLRTDQSVAEAAAAIKGLETGQAELTVAMYERLADRWRMVEALESAN